MIVDRPDPELRPVERPATASSVASGTFGPFGPSAPALGAV